MANLAEFLKLHITKKEDREKHPITHTRIGDTDLKIYGGSYHIPQEELPQFYKLYYEHVFVANKAEYLTEKQYGHAIAIYS